MPKAVFFPHDAENFVDEFYLRNWLDLTLRKHRDGWYHLKKGGGLGSLEKGSYVFFYRNNFVVGSAVVELDKREITEEEQDPYWEEFENVVKFIPDSIWAWKDHQFLSKVEVDAILAPKTLSHYVTVDDLKTLLSIFEAVAGKYPGP